MLTPPRAIFFDLDETLLDGSGLGEAIARTCNSIATVRPGLDTDRLLAANGAVWSAYWPEVEDKWTLGILDGAAVSLEAWRRTLQACGCYDEALARFALETLSQHSQKTIRLFDDARELIQAFTGRVPLGLVTNGASDTQREKLRLAGIESSFGIVLISGETGVAKPDARIFQFGLAKLGIDPADVWHIGDNLRTDVGGAKAAGLTAVWLNRTGVERKPEDPTPDLEIGTLSELSRLLSLA